MRKWLTENRSRSASPQNERASSATAVPLTDEQLARWFQNRLDTRCPNAVVSEREREVERQIEVVRALQKLAAEAQSRAREAMEAAHRDATEQQSPSAEVEPREGDAAEGDAIEGDAAAPAMEDSDPQQSAAELDAARAAAQNTARDGRREERERNRHKRPRE